MTIVHTTQYPRVLSVAGSDSSGGAGIQADLKTFSALGCFGMTAITALTAQNTQGVQGVWPVPAEFVKKQLRSVLDDVGVDAVKIGMLHSPDVVDAVAATLHEAQAPHMVLDTVMVASSGDTLTLPQTVEQMVKRLFPLATVVTPNLDEISVFLGRPVREVTDMEAAALALISQGARSVLLKGGHLSGDVLSDCWVQSGQPTLWLHRPRIDSTNVHGTGCTLSSAVAAYLALGHGVQEAVRRAHEYVGQAIEHGAHVRTGQGCGPLNHGFAPQRMQTISLDKP